MDKNEQTKEALVEMMEKLKCWICGNTAVGVAASPMGPVSGAYCKECLRAGREPWGILVGGLSGCERGETAEWVKPVIKATLEYYEKTEKDLWDDVEKNDLEYDKYMQEHDDHESDPSVSPKNEVK